MKIDTAIKTGRFALTEEMARYIRLQRTCFAHEPVEVLAETYFRSCMRDYEDIAFNLKKDPAQVLDIGCGLAGVDVLLHRILNSSPDLYLFDLNADPAARPVKYGYSIHPQAYNQLELTREFVESNGVAPASACFMHRFPASLRFDLVISIISMGFHYPVTTYLDRISTDCLILDIRKGTPDQMAALRAKFARVEVIRDYRKYERVVCRR